MTKTLIVPGLDGSPAPHWQHWWAATDPSALMIGQEDFGTPDPDLWEAELAGAVFSHPNSVLVGHSLGAVLIARLLARWPQVRVRAAMLVAPARPDVSPRTAPFGRIPARPLQVPATVVASRNDPWMSFIQARSLSDSWGAELIDLGFAGHVNVAAGFGPWRRGIELRDALVSRAATPATARRDVTAGRSLA